MCAMRPPRVATALLALALCVSLSARVESAVLYCGDVYDTRTCSDYKEAGACELPDVLAGCLKTCGAPECANQPSSPPPSPPAEASINSVRVKLPLAVAPDSDESFDGYAKRRLEMALGAALRRPGEVPPPAEVVFNPVYGFDMVRARSAADECQKAKQRTPANSGRSHPTRLRAIETSRQAGPRAGRHPPPFPARVLVQDGRCRGGGARDHCRPGRPGLTLLPLLLQR